MSNLSKEALDDLINELRTWHPLDINGDRAADTITALRAENEALKEAHGEQERYLREAEQWKARATAAEAKLAAAMEGAARVKALEWSPKPTANKNAVLEESESFGLRYAAWGGGAWSVFGSGVSTTYASGDDTEKNIDAAKAAAQADYERRILAALEPDPEARHARDLAAARAALEAVKNVRQWEYYPIAMPITADGKGPATIGEDAAKIRGLYT